MARLTLLAFASARDVLGFSEMECTAETAETPRAVVERLFPGKFPQLAQARPALDQVYATWETPLGSSTELAILPPVSGG